MAQQYPQGRGAAPRSPVWNKGQAGDPTGYIEAIEATIAAGALIWPDPIGLQIGGGVIPAGDHKRGYWIDAEGGSFYAKWQGPITTVTETTFADFYAWAAANPDRPINTCPRSRSNCDGWVEAGKTPGRLGGVIPGVGPGTLPGRLQWYAPTEADLDRGDDGGTIELAGDDWGKASANGQIKPWQIAALLGAALLAARM